MRSNRLISSWLTATWWLMRQWRTKRSFNWRLTVCLPRRGWRSFLQKATISVTLTRAPARKVVTAPTRRGPRAIKPVWAIPSNKGRAAAAFTHSVRVSGSQAFEPAQNTALRAIKERPIRIKRLQSMTLPGHPNAKERKKHGIKIKHHVHLKTKANRPLKAPKMIL